MCLIFFADQQFLNENLPETGTNLKNLGG